MLVQLLLLVGAVGVVHAAQDSSPSIPAVEQHSMAEQDHIHFESTWEALGPFQVGTREAIWGADPLAAFGGFSALHYDSSASFASSLAFNGAVGWTRHNSEPDYASEGATVALDIAFSSGDWRGLRDVYGWAGAQYQGWVRSTFELVSSSPRRVALFSEQALEFNIDNQSYFGGDLFSYRRAPLILTLDPGKLVIELRLVRDARAMGITADVPSVQAKIELLIAHDQPNIDGENTILPDVVNGKFASSHGSISIQNFCNHPIEVLEVSAADLPGILSMRDVSVTLQPGQTRPIALQLSTQPLTVSLLSVHTVYRTTEKGAVPKNATTISHLQTRRIDEIHKFTYLHPSGIVSYSMIRPPHRAPHSTPSQLPVMINLHGAGLAVESPQMTKSLDDISDMPLWFLFPSGVTSWSSDDWHNWGWQDVQAAIAAIPDWIQNNYWEGSGADVQRLFVVGHSNGGQGTIFALTHWPDLVIAAAPASAYLSIQAYVPFQLWKETDPSRWAVLNAAVNSYRHELLVSNCRGIPIFLQHGSADGNVPAFHSRRLGQLLQEQSIVANYSEVEGKDHWWDGAQVTKELQKFYLAHANSPAPEKRPTDFTLIVANPADTGSKHGLRVGKCHMPGQLCSVDVTIHQSLVVLQTSNVLEMSFPSTWTHEHQIQIDEQEFKSSEYNTDGTDLTVSRVHGGVWKIEEEYNDSWSEKSNRLLGGGLQALLRTSRRVGIRTTEESSRSIASMVARNLYQYFAADVLFSVSTNKFEEPVGNIITIGTGDNIGNGILANHPIRVDTESVRVRGADGIERSYKSKRKDLGAVFFRPTEEGRIELVVWGSNSHGLSLASRLVPTITGAGQADFVVINSDSQWKGAGGAVAMGFFDTQWNVTATSFLQ